MIRVMLVIAMRCYTQKRMYLEYALVQTTVDK